MEDCTVVIAKERGPLGVVCWCVDDQGNAFWGAYGLDSALAAFEDRTGVSPDMSRPRSAIEQAEIAATNADREGA